MKKTIYLLTPIIMILLSGMASAAFTMTVNNINGSETAVGSSTLRGVIRINVTLSSLSETDGSINITSCNATFVSSLTANNTNTVADYDDFYNNVPVDGNATFLINVTTTFLEDANDYTLYVKCMNETANTTGTQIYNQTVSGAYVVDNTVPTAATLTSPANQWSNLLNNSMSFVATITDANTIYAYIYWRDSTPTGHKRDTMTCSASTCTYSTESVADGTYYWGVETDDGRNTTISSYNSFIVNFQDMTGASKAIIYGVVEEAASKPKIPPIVIIIGLVIVAYLIATKGGKKKIKI